MIKTMRVLQDNMRRAAATGFINATDCADYLVRKGVSFRRAYRITGKLVAECIKKDTTLEKLPIEVYRIFSDKFEDDIYAAIDLDACVNGRNATGGPSRRSVLSQIRNVRRMLSD